MEASDYLYRIANDFHLGRYLEVLEGYKDYKASNAFDQKKPAHLDIIVLLQKTIIFFFRNCEDVVRQNEGILGDLTSMIDFFMKYFAPTLLPLPIEEAEGMLAELETERSLSFVSAEDFEELRKLLANHIQFSLRKFAKLQPIGKKHKEMHFAYKSMVISGFLINKQFKDADRELADLQLTDDEHVLIGLLGIQRALTRRDFDGALSLLADLKEKFGDSMKLANLKSSCLVGLLRLEEVF